MSKIIRFVSKYNTHCIETVICADDKVQEEIAKKKNFVAKVNDWYGDKVWIMIINSIKVKEVNTGCEYKCEGCIFYMPKLINYNHTVCTAPDDIVCHIDTIFIKDE